MLLKRKSAGFTLLEITVVLVIVGLLLGGGMQMMSATQDVARYKESDANLAEVKQALIAYYSQFQRLPCPDAVAPFDGNSDATTCTTDASLRGFVPYVTLGIGGAKDAWGESFKYVVNKAFTDTNNNVSLCTPTNGTPFSRDITKSNRIQIFDTSTTATKIGDWAAFGLVSTGKDGRQTNVGMSGAFSGDGGCPASDTTVPNGLERENCDADFDLRYGTQLSDSRQITFDDSVAWVGDLQLISDLREAGGCTNTSSSGGGGGGSTVKVCCFFIFCWPC